MLMFGRTVLGLDLEVCNTMQSIRLFMYDCATVLKTPFLWHLSNEGCVVCDPANPSAATLEG